MSASTLERLNYDLLGDPFSKGLCSVCPLPHWSGSITTFEFPFVFL